MPDQRGHSRLLLNGRLDTNWSPSYASRYSLVWALHVEGARLHTGGVRDGQRGYPDSYARFSRASIKGNERPNTLAGTPMVTPSTATVAPTASTHGAAATPCASVAARTKDAGARQRPDPCGGREQGRHLLWPWFRSGQSEPGGQHLGGCEKVRRIGTKVG